LSSSSSLDLGSPIAAANEEKGQIDPGLVWGIVTMLVAISIGGLIYSKISGQLDEQTDENSIGENVKEEVDD